nr:MAG TPA: hypothetical protein [Caudoviricetes sp.]
MPVRAHPHTLLYINYVILFSQGWAHIVFIKHV